MGDIGTLTKDIISGSSYRFYSSFVVPINLTAGACYYLAVVDATDSTVKYLSNKLIASNSIKSNMKLIRYRNDKNILNFNYESLSTLYNQFVIELAVIQSQYPTTRIGYDLVSGAFKEVRSTAGVNKKFITRSYNSDNHEAFNAATIHNTYQISEDGDWTTYTRTDDADYSVDWVDEFELAHGEITLQKDTTFASSKAI